MNYVEDAKELVNIPADAEPVGFLKPDTSLIGPGDAIMLPVQSELVTAEAELAIIIGKKCKNISEAEAPSAVAGFTTTLDITAADIHAKNQRFLTRSKSFDTFFGFGSHLLTVDEIPDVLSLTVQTCLNGEVIHQNIISNMRFRPWYAVSFHSQVMTLLPGDIILTGTPGPVVIRNGDRVECRINGFEPIMNIVTE
jgi:2-keto-4-pentenoate hydratase/2-oxohepta-3-ene-1,7-dioic acid hydratase in catechol pathway